MAYTLRSPDHILLRLEKPCLWCLVQPRAPNARESRNLPCCSDYCYEKWLAVRQVARRPGERRCFFCEGRLVKRDQNGVLKHFCGSRCKKAAEEFRFGMGSSQKIFDGGRWYDDAYTLYHARMFLPAHPKIASEFTQCENHRQVESLVKKYKTLGCVRLDWKDVQDDVLEDVLRLKFGRSHELRMALKSIEQRFIIADMPHDNFWGNGSDGRGENRLGKALTKLRDTLRDDVFNT